MRPAPLPRVMGIVGSSGSGKTRLITRVIPVLIARGLKVATIKHAHHDFDIDVPGKDSYEHRKAGAFEVILSSARRWVHLHENGEEGEAPLEQLLQRLSPCDLVLIEGFKGGAHAKLEVYRPRLGKAPRYPVDPQILAVASDEPLAALPLPALDLDDLARIANFIAANAREP